MEHIDRSNRFVQWLVIALAVIAIGVSGVQTYFTINARHESHKPATTSARYTEPSATELFALKAKCEELAEKLDTVMVHGAAIAQDHTSHYNIADARCYVELDSHDIEKFWENNSRYLYDGQTHELLAWITHRKGTTTAYANGTMSSEEAATAQFDAAMSDQQPPTKAK